MIYYRRSNWSWSQGYIHYFRMYLSFKNKWYAIFSQMYMIRKNDCKILNKLTVFIFVELKIHKNKLARINLFIVIRFGNSPSLFLCEYCLQFFIKENPVHVLSECQSLNKNLNKRVIWLYHVFEQKVYKAKIHLR